MNWRNCSSLRALVVAASFGVAAFSGLAVAQDDEEDEDPRIGLYSSEVGENSFVLDRTEEFAQLKFTEDDEIISLETVPGPRGDTFFKDGCGNTVLRLTPFGGATLYNSETQQGEAFGRTQQADPLRLAPIAPDAAAKIASQAFEAFEEDYGYGLVFEADFHAGPQEGAQAATLTDTVRNTLTALRRISRDEVGREILGERLNQVSFHSAEQKSVALTDQHLVVRYQWGAGVSGRPSSAAIVCYLENNL